ncbi:phosphoglycerate kinase [Holotrichia oblita]|nr:phosphoglycerate kinase [Holotrichia oblita]
MVSVKALSHNSRKTQTLLTLAENEAPSAVQLFGHDPQAFERTIKSGIFDKFDIIDINMGCPAPKIVQNGDGSALLKNFDLARQIIETCVASTTKPITVKFRKGYGLDDNIAVEFAKMCESAGASAITVHPRTRDQFYSGKADYSVISDVVKAVSIPVIANGDVVDIKSYNEILKTGCAAVMIGRGALGKPEIFAKLLDKNIKVNKLAQIKEHLSLIKALFMPFTKQLARITTVIFKDKETVKRTLPRIDESIPTAAIVPAVLTCVTQVYSQLVSDFFLSIDYLFDKKETDRAKLTRDCIDVGEAVNDMEKSIIKLSASKRMKTTIKDIDLKGKRVLLRVDFNVPQDESGKIIDDNRIMEALATINYLSEHGAKIVACSHLGRPKGIDKKLTLKPVAERLAQLVKFPVHFAEDIIGTDAKAKVKALKEGEVLLLENIRFDEGEEKNDPKFAKELASFADIYINDAFGTAHRKHASTYGVATLLPNAVGFLMGKEVKVISSILTEAKHPFVAILGGAKIADKIPVVENLLKKVDTLIIVGGVAYTFTVASGGKVGKSMVDKNNIEFAKKMLAEAKANNVKIILPIDNIAAQEFKADAKFKKFKADEIPDDYIGMDIGPKTVKAIKKEIKDAATVIWCGSMGVYEFPKTAKGTKAAVKALAAVKGFTFVGGGDSAAAAIQLGYSKRINHVSTGGGASLEMLEGKILPGVDIITELGAKKTVAEKPAAAKPAAVKTSSTKKTATQKAPAKKTTK